MTNHNKIGIDRTVLCNVSITEVDMVKLTDAFKHINDSGSSATKIQLLEGTPTVVPEHNIRKISICDKRYGQLTIQSKRNYQTQQVTIASEFQLSPVDNGNNIKNLSVCELKSRIRAAVKHYNAFYGLKLDVSQLKIRSMEINTTIKLKEEIGAYTGVLALFCKLLPVKYYKDCKLMVWQERHTGQSESFTVRNSSVELKIYNKAKQLRDAQIILLPDNLLRIEYVFHRLQHSPLKNPEELTDQLIQNQFLRFFRRDIVKPYQSWIPQHTEKLRQLLQVHRTSSRYWIDSFCRDCRYKNATEPFEALYDLEILKAVLKDELSGDKNRSRKLKAIMSQFQYETDLRGNVARAEEILQYILDSSLE